MHTRQPGASKQLIFKSDPGPLRLPVDVLLARVEAPWGHFDSPSVPKSVKKSNKRVKNCPRIHFFRVCPGTLKYMFLACLAAVWGYLDTPHIPKLFRRAKMDGNAPQSQGTWQKVHGTTGNWTKIGSKVACKRTNLCRTAE